MNFVAQLEECLRDLGVESRKKHPGVKEASERAILKLRTLQNEYVSAVRKANNGERHPDTTLFRSSDLLHPFLLAANYPNASFGLLETSFKAMKLLMEANAICSGDGMNMVRVWMIQAQVVVSYSTKETSVPTAVSGSADPLNAMSTAQSTGWFGGLLSSSSLAAASALDRNKTTNSVSTKTAVSSSHGQAGSGKLNAKDLEKLALDILSCLLQLLELRDLPVTTEQWIQSVTLCCLLYLPLRQNVRQAAHSTLPQVLNLLVQDKNALQLAIKTWDDLLTCTVGLDVSTKSFASKKFNLHGAFSHCRLGAKDSAQPPSPALSMELMTMVLKQVPHIFSHVGQKTLGVTVQMLLKQSANTNSAPLEYLRTIQFVLVVIQTQSKEWPTECRELIARLIQPIRAGTEALRKQADFEDGYVYNISSKNLATATTNLETLQGLPPSTLWKASLSLEILQNLVQDTTLTHIWLHAEVVTNILEATSDFCTIGASCREHINLLILASRQKDKEHGLAYSAESLTSLRLWKSGRNKDEKYILGDALWIGLNLILRIIDSLNDNVLEASFAPSFASLQHYLKRLPASGIIVKKALEGYFSLATISLRFPLLRRVLLSSLCKLSLPKWGTQDAICSLRDHNIAALICLLNLIHRYYNDIGSEWLIILQTFQELSKLAIASPYLSDRAYVGALSISAVYSRFASFSTVLSDESFIHFVKALREASVMDKTKSDVITSPARRIDTASLQNLQKEVGRDERESIGEKLMNIGVRAIYGGSDCSNAQTEDVPLAERTKNTYFHDYQMEFSRRLGNSRHPIRVDVVPFSFSLLADVTMANSFRDGRCIESMINQLCALAQESPSTRFFSMDMIAILIISYVGPNASLPASFIGPGKIVYEDPRQNQYIAVERIRGPDRERLSVSQLDLFCPLCECIRNAKVSCIVESGLEVLHSLLENLGHELGVEAWKEIIEAMSSIPSASRTSADWSESCLAGFRCLKLIVDDFSGETNSFTSVRASLLDCCASFGSSRHDVNTSLTAIGLLWTIADQDAGSTSIELALAKLVILTSDTRAEVRDCSVNTLFSCIVGRGQAFSGDQWEACISNMVLKVHDLVVENIGVDETASNIDETHTPGKSRYRVSVHHSRDSAGKQWMATQSLVLRGLSRVLRNFFYALLDTMDGGLNSSDKNNENPWFEKAWNKILSHAFDAATQTGGRDTLDLRSSGVELLVLCNQLACSAGIEAAITPARVGTNMEVVNGALRSVRVPDKASVDKDSPRKSHSTITETWRENLFLDAFDVLDSFREHSEAKSGLVCMDSTQVQVLSKFACDLSKLYDCCRDGEFGESKAFDGISSLEKYLVVNTSSITDEDTLVVRFVRIVMTVASTSSTGSDARFLSQAQKCCIDLLRSMASNGSFEAFLNLSFLSRRSFFSERDGNGKPQKGVDILSHEASTVIYEELRNQNVSDECRVLVLCRLLYILLEGDRDNDRQQQNCAMSYRLLVPLVEPCLKSAKEIERNFSSTSNQSGAKLQLLDVFWERLCVALAKMLSPVSKGPKSMTILHASDLVDIVKNVSQYSPPEISSELSAILGSGASKCLELMKLDAIDANESQDDAKAEEHQDKMLNLFMACFGGVCTLEPEEKSLSVLAEDVLSASRDSMACGSLEPDSSLLEQLNLKACVLVCQVLQETEGIERLAISVFPLLCELVGAENSSVHQAAGGVLSKVNVGKVLKDTQRRWETAEARAKTAEKKVANLMKQLEQVSKEKEALERQLAFIG